MKNTQEQRVTNRLLKVGSITRNECLGTYPCISRLGAIICDLKQKGWDFETKDTGKDYVYTVVKSPYKVVKRVLSNGEVIVTHEKTSSN